jgi:hypothetical protein
MNKEQEKQLEELKKRIEKLGKRYWLKEKEGRQHKRGESTTDALANEQSES